MGTRGDVQPYVALAAGLRRAGHHVRLITSASYTSLAHGHDLDIWELPGDVHAAMQTPEMRALMAKGDFLAINAHSARLIDDAISGWSATAHAACRGACLLISGMGGLFLAAAVAQSLAIPLLQAYLVPFTPTRAFPAVVLPAHGIPRPLNDSSHRLFRWMMWQGFKAADARARQQILGIAPAPWDGPYRFIDAQQTPVLYGISPSILNKPADWGPQTHVVGDWHLADPHWEAPAELVEFCAGAEPPIFIGFGSMVDPNPAEMGRMVATTLAETGLRAVVQGEWATHIPATAPVLRIGSVPHHWLFPRMRAIVHHGGAGTTAAAVRAGVPNWIVPFFGDQSFWGRRMHLLGVGPAPIPRRHLHSERFVAAVRQLITEASMRERAQYYAERVGQEAGVDTAVRIINAYLATPRPK
jgi:sterol 3beta-glucosyltransferase